MSVDIFDMILLWPPREQLQLISIFLAICGGIFALIQWKRSNKIKNAEFINNIVEKLRFDKEISRVRYVIEYNPNWYDNTFHGNKNGLEPEIDKFFAYLSYLCYLKRNKLISGNEFSFLQYDLNRLCRSPSAKAYLWNLYHFSKKSHSTCAFHELIGYGLKSGILTDQFKDSNCSAYISKKYLNF